MALAPHRRRVRGRVHHLAALRRGLQEPSLDARLPRQRDALHGPARICGADHSDGHRLCGLGRDRRGRAGDRRHLLLRREPRRRPPAAAARPHRLHRRAQAGGALMAYDEGLYAWTAEALEPLGSVTMRKMMGGATLYLDGAIFAILVDGELWFKSDEEANAFWDGEGCTERFTVTFRDGTVQI